MRNAQLPPSTRNPRRPKGRRAAGGAAATIREVAREASVSVATVSRVLNGKGPVHLETARRIRSVAKRLHYVPHPVARSLITRRTHTLGVLLPDLYGEFFSEVIRGIDLCARRAGYHVVVSSSHSDSAETEAMIRAMRGRVDGLIVLSPGARTPALSSLPRGFPLVLLNSPVAGLSTHSRSTITGARRDGPAPGRPRPPADRVHQRASPTTATPRSGCEAIATPCAPGPPMPTRSSKSPGDFTRVGRATTRAGAILGRSVPGRRRSLRPTTRWRSGCLSAFREAGVHVPEDFAVAGFDDIPIARYITPPLTSVRVSIAELGERAMGRLLAAFRDGRRHVPRHETLPTRLVERRSSGTPHMKPQASSRHVHSRREIP